MPTLKQGSSGTDVTHLQQRLKDLGFNPKGVDGNFGAGTRDAVIAFQHSQGLADDGIAGPNTLAALQSPSSSAGAGSSGTVSANIARLNLGGLTGHVPDQVISQIPQTAKDFDITSNLRLAHFLAQCALESSGFTATVENLNYSASRLRQIFPKYFRNVDPAAYANNREKIGNRVYANRMGNGDEASGEGFKYRGRGYIQLTGKDNYTSFSGFIGEDCVANPELVSTRYPLASAGFFFKSNNIWSVCDRGADDATVTAVSTRVNGNPPHAVPERLQNFKEFMRALA